MLEKLGDHSEATAESAVDGANSLEEMANQFDPKKAEEERRKAGEKVLFAGEASRLTEDENGKAKLESEYMDAWSRYKEGENYDENDKELNHAIWDVGFGAALLDVDKNVTSKLQNGEDLFDLMDQDSRILHVFDKAFSDMAKIAKSDNKAAAKEAIDYIENTGRVGKFIVDEYETWEQGKSDLKDNNSEEKQPEYAEELSRLEERLAKLNSGKTVDSEEIDSLIAEYRALSKNIYDPKTLEMVKKRYESLAQFRERLENISHIVDFD